MTLGEILTACYQQLGFGASSPTAADTARLTTFINAAYKEIMSDPILETLRRRTVAVPTVANSPYLAFPASVVDIFEIVDRTNQFQLEERDQSWIRDSDPGRVVTSANPMVYAVVDRASPVAAQPSNSSQLYVKSTAAGDITQNAYIEVITSQGYVRQATITLNGVTGTTLGPADSVDIEDFYLSAVPAGEVILMEDSVSGTELARIGIGRTRSRYMLLELFPIPSAVVTLYADVKIRVTDLVNSTDEPLIDDEFCEAIVHGVRRREFNKREKPALAQSCKADAAPFIGRLHLHAHKKSGQSSAGRPVRWSQLGPYYSEGS